MTVRNEWASDETFPSGSLAGSPTKVEPSAGLLATGIEPGQMLGAQQYNALMNYLTRSVGVMRDAAYAHWDARTPSGTPTFLGATIPASVGAFELMALVGTGATIQTSRNGSTWTARTAGSAYAGDLNGIANNGVTLVAVGATGGIQSSTDGITWTARTPDSSFAGTFQAIASNPTATLTSPDYVAVGASGTIQSSSDGGTTWVTNLPGPPPTVPPSVARYSGTFTSIAFDPTANMWCAVGSGGEIQIAPHGAAPLTWTRIRTGSENLGYVCPRLGGDGLGGFVIAFDDGTPAAKIITYIDGPNIGDYAGLVTRVVSTPAYAPRAICLGPDGRRIVISGTDGYVYDAEIADLTVWSQRWVAGADPAVNIFYALASSYGCTGGHGGILAAGYRCISQSLRTA